VTNIGKATIAARNRAFIVRFMIVSRVEILDGKKTHVAQPGLHPWQRHAASVQETAAPIPRGVR
jgi:hypothetical protein